MTVLITPDGPSTWQVCVQTFAGTNPIGSRLYKLTDKQRQEHRIELPSLETRELDRETAELRCREWSVFLQLQEKLKTKRK